MRTSEELFADLDDWLIHTVISDVLGHPAWGWMERGVLRREADQPCSFCCRLCFLSQTDLTAKMMSFITDYDQPPRDPTVQVACAADASKSQWPTRDPNHARLRYGAGERGFGSGAGGSCWGVGGNVTFSRRRRE